MEVKKEEMKTTSENTDWTQALASALKLTFIELKVISGFNKKNSKIRNDFEKTLEKNMRVESKKYGVSFK